MSENNKHVNTEPDQDEMEARNYSSKKYRTPDGVPADIVMFTLTKRERKTVTKTLPIRELKVMLIKRKGWPFAGRWALPGGFAKRMSPYTAQQSEN